MNPAHLLKNLRKLINPPYSGSNIFAIIGSILILIAIPVTVLYSLQSRPLGSRAADPAKAGSVKVWKNANSGFDVYTADPSKYATINSRYQGMLVYEPYSDDYLSWYTGNALFYKDAYTIKTYPLKRKDNALDDWILRDVSGNPCYIPWGTPPYDQYAGDIGSQAFKSNWINYAVDKLNNFPGYAGINVDDVNLDDLSQTGISRVSCGDAYPSGNNNLPVDPRTGTEMTGTDWNRYMADFMEEVRAAIPDKLISHNTIWYITSFTNNDLLREIQAADIIQMEQGFHDPGLTSGTGKYSWLRKMDFVDLVHANGAVVHDRDEGVSSDAQQEYGVANYLLLNNGEDYYDPVYKSSPDDPWDVYGADLGAATGDRYLWNGVWRRDFDKGIVLVNPPEESPKTLNLGATYDDLYGAEMSSVTLGAKTGKVLLNQTVIGGGTYYVDCNAGNDSNSGTSKGASWKTITKVNDSAFSAGDQVLFKRGATCVGNLRLTTNKNEIYVGAYGSGELPIIKSNDWKYGAVNFEGSGVTVENIWVTADPPDGYDSGCDNNPVGYRLGFAFANGSTGNVVKFSKATGLWAGVDFKLGSSNNKLFNSEIKDNIMMDPLNALPDTEPGGGDAGAFGIIFHGDDNEAAYNTISGHDACSYDYGRDGGAAEIFGGKNNYIHHNRGINNSAFTETGDSRSDNNIIAYNIVTSTLDKATFVNTRGQTNYGPVKHTRVYNNTVYFTGANSQGIICSSCYLTGDTSTDAILSAKNNIVWAEKKALFTSQAFDEGNNIYWKIGGDPLIQGPISNSSKVVDPKFLAVGTDFHLQSTSPAIDAGVNVGYSQDYEETAVPQGAAVDIGAFEFGSGSPPSGFQPTAPYHATFFYPWYKTQGVDGQWAHWEGNGHSPPANWDANYLPDPNPGAFDPANELYSSNDNSIKNWQFQKMAEANIEVAISSWWGIDDPTDLAFSNIIKNVMNSPSNSYPNLRWAIYYEKESKGDPSISEIVADLNHIQNQYGNEPGMLKIGGKPVVFVYGAGIDGSGMVSRWEQVRNQTNFYINLQVYPGFESNSSKADSWHQYNPTKRGESHAPYSAFVSPGFWKVGESPVLERNLTEFRTAISLMVQNNTIWKLIETWNEWHEGTTVEPGEQAIQTFSGNAVLDPSGAPYKNEYVRALGDILPALEKGTGGPVPLIGDLNDDGAVNIFDASIMTSKWGTSDPVVDINGDGIVNIFDASILTQNWTG